MPADPASFEVNPNGTRFGEMCVALNLATAGQVQNALAEQAARKAKGVAARLGDLLVELKVLNLRQQQKVLLEQQRLRKATESATKAVPRKHLGPYELLAKLGEGGMGAVYKARDSAGRMVALKVLRAQLKSDPQFFERFKREAKAVGALNHPNIVAAFAAGEEDGIPFLAMEFVEGQSLYGVLKSLGKLDEKKALQITRDVAKGLGHAHQHGFVHRDIKPDNVLIGDGVVKVTDLGLAKSLNDDQRLTKTGIALGTPHYISPEQARGRKDVDHRSDIYSLGATMYVLLTGRTPFDGKNNAEIMLKHLKEELENPQDLVPELSDGCVDILAKMMAKQPDDRYADCAALVADIEKVLSGQSLQPMAVADNPELSSVRPPKRRAVRRRPAARKDKGGCMVVLIACAGGLATLIGGAGWALGRLFEA